MKTLLKYHLQKFEKALVFCIIDQDVNQRATSGKEFRYSTSRGDYVISCRVPDIAHQSDIGTTYVYIQGANLVRENEVVVHKFKNNDERDKVFNRIQKALSEWCQNGGFDEAKKKPQKTETVLDPNVYELTI